jgi:hypothetical protein
VRPRLAALAAGAALVLAACGISPDEAPRDIAAPAPAADVQDGRSVITATQTTVIYLVGHDDDGRFVLMPIARDATETINNALLALFDGPTARELNADLRTAIPATTRLVKAVPNNDVVKVDVSDALLGLNGSALVDAIGQIVLTATNVTGITSVVITIDDIPHPWPRPDGSTTLEPLRRKDYESLLPDRRTPVTDPTVDTVPTTASTTTVAPATAPPVVETPPATTVADTVAPAETPPAETVPAPDMGPSPTPG